MKRLVLVLLLLLFLVAFNAFGQVQTGNLFGTIVANDGSPLPGVTVWLTGIGAPQVTVTDARGDFRFLSLWPGTYTVHAELAGFGTATQSGINVRLGGNPYVTITINPSVAQSITVTADAPLLDVRKTGTGATIPKAEMEAIPTGRDPWVILQQTPGVLMDRVNIGGNESGQQSIFTGKGAMTEQSSWNIDGVNITDVGALGSSPTYYDFDSLEEMQITTGGSDPRIQTPGVQLNIVTKRGTNDFSGSARYLTTKNAWQSEPRIPSEAGDYLQTANEIDDIADWGIEAGGPVLPNRLWLWGAYSDQQIDLLQASGTDGITDLLLRDDTTLETFNVKLNAQLAAGNHATLAVLQGDKIKFGRNVGPTRPVETGHNQDNTYPAPTLWKLEDTHVFNSSFYLTALYSKTEGGFQLISDNGERCTGIDCGLGGLPTTWDYGSGPDGEYGTPDDGDGLPHNSFFNYFTERPQDQYRVDGSLFVNTGALAHELKFGAGVRDADVRSLFAWPGDQLVFLNTNEAFWDNTLPGAHTVQVNRFSDFTYNVKSTDFYVGDTLLLGNLTVQAGLRFDIQSGVVEGGTAPANPLAPDLFPALDYDKSEELEWSTISPRIGLTYALGADKKTLLRAAANRYVDQMGGYTVYGVSPASYSYTYHVFDDVNGNLRADAGEIRGGVYGFLGLDPDNPTAPVRRWDDDLEAPHTDELLFGVEREVFSDFVFGVTGTYRRMVDHIELAPEKGRGSGVFYGPEDFIIVGHTDVGGVANGGPSYGSIPIYDYIDGAPLYYVFRNRPDYSQTYKGLELTGMKRMSNRWMMRGSFTWQDWTQNVGEGAIIDPTRLRVGGVCSTCDGGIVSQGSGTGSGPKGGVYINSKWAYNLTGAYQIPVIDTLLGFSLAGRQGYPIPYIERVSVSSGFKPVLVTDDIDEHRLPNLLNLDLRLAKDLSFGPVGFTISADVFNVFNRNTVLQRNVTSGPGTPFDQNKITELLSPRIVRLGARFTF